MVVFHGDTMGDFSDFSPASVGVKQIIKPEKYFLMVFLGSKN